MPDLFFCFKVNHTLRTISLFNLIEKFICKIIIGSKEIPKNRLYNQFKVRKIAVMKSPFPPLKFPIYFIMWHRKCHNGNVINCCFTELTRLSVRNASQQSAFITCKTSNYHFKFNILVNKKTLFEICICV